MRDRLDGRFGQPESSRGTSWLTRCWHLPEFTSLEQPTTINNLLRDLGKPVTTSTSLPVLLDQSVTAIAEQGSGAALICGFPERLGGPAAPHPSRLGCKQRSELRRR